ncbi:MAG: hypothetical protein M3Y27_08390 [Acidobacteriota bacterium]|nr:hypothetical protein [Acidobacteriota bacterium]
MLSLEPPDNLANRDTAGKLDSPAKADRLAKTDKWDKLVPVTIPVRTQNHHGRVEGIKKVPARTLPAPAVQRSLSLSYRV